MTSIIASLSPTCPVIAPDGEAKDMPSGVGVNHVGYTFANPGELLETYARLKDAGIKPYWQVHHGVTLSVYYRDPDGNRMEFQVDCCANADAAHAFMYSEAFAANPAGVDIDADALLAQHRKGASAEQLLAMPVGSPAQIPAEHGLM
jgi:catechol-2,3-dioxygenase